MEEPSIIRSVGVFCVADIIYASFLSAVSELFFMNLSYSYCLILMDNTNGIKYTVTMKAFQKTEDDICQKQTGTLEN